MKRFQIGQAITMITNRGWALVGRSDDPYGDTPVFGKIYHVRAYDSYISGAWYILLEEFSRTSFEENRFAPVISNKELAEALSEIATQEVVNA